MKQKYGPTCGSRIQLYGFYAQKSLWVWNPKYLKCRPLGLPVLDISQQHHLTPNDHHQGNKEPGLSSMEQLYSSTSLTHNKEGQWEGEGEADWQTYGQR